MLEPANEPESGAHRVRIPWFPPSYSEVRHLLRTWTGYKKSQIRGLHSSLAELMGTPQNPVNWRDPDTWITDRLSGQSQELASEIWTESGKSVNPRYTDGAWILIRNYELLDDGKDGRLEVTERGRDFIENRLGEAEAFLDQQEGLIELLKIVNDNGSARSGAFVGAWGNFLEQHSKFNSPSTIRDTLSRRLRNVLNRELVKRQRLQYSITEAGFAYLKRFDSVSRHGELTTMRKLAMKRTDDVRGLLLGYILQMKPAAFEQLVARVLEAMDYQNVEVIGQSGDGGVDVVADIELGVTSVREVVQGKRHRQTIQRKDLDALRGSLHRFDAVRGTIVTTSSFSRGTRDAAFEQGAAPITLIDGPRLLDLLVSHEIGVRKHSIEVLSIDLDGISEIIDLEHPEYQSNANSA